MVCVSALWCLLATPTILLGFLLLWAWGISSWLLQQSAAAAPYLVRGISPHCRPSWHGSSIFNFLRKLCAIFHRSCLVPPIGHKGSKFSSSLPTLVIFYFFFFFDSSYPNGCEVAKFFLYFFIKFLELWMFWKYPISQPLVVQFSFQWWWGFK